MPPKKKPRNDLEEESSPQVVIKDEIDEDTMGTEDGSVSNGNGDTGTEENERSGTDHHSDDEDLPVKISIVNIEALCESSSDEELTIPEIVKSYDPEPQPVKRTYGRAAKSKVETVKNISAMDDKVKECISECVASKQDPCTTFQFYATVFKTISLGLNAGIIRSQDVDHYWKKYDAMAAKSLSKTPLSQAVAEAADLSRDPPRNSKISTKTAANYIREVEYFCQNMIITVGETKKSVRENLFVRRRFYETFGNGGPSFEDIFNFYMNILVNRVPSVYGVVGELVKLGTLRPAGSPRTRLNKAFLEPAIHQRVFDADRLMKMTINFCMWDNTDPRARHIYYLNGSQALRASGGDETKWKIWDGWAKEAYQKRQEFLIAREQYHFVEILPTLKSKRVPGLTAGKKPSDRFLEFMDELVKQFIAEKKVDGHDDTKWRLEFYGKYGEFVPVDLDSVVVDQYWRKLERENYLSISRQNRSANVSLNGTTVTTPGVIAPAQPASSTQNYYVSESVATARPVSHIIPRTVYTKLKISLSADRQNGPKQLVITHGRESTISRVIQL